MRRVVTALVCAGLAACGSSKRSTPDADAICAGTAKPRDAIVLHAGDPAAGGKARGVRELASRAPNENALPLAELDRFLSASDASAIFTAHVAERERKLREDLEIARATVQTMKTAIPAVDLDSIERFPVSPAGATSTTPKAAELLKPLHDGSAVRSVAERATALARALDDLANKTAALDTQTDAAATRVRIAEAIKIANVAHGKLNEAVATLHTHAATVAALADEQGGRAFAANARLWTRLTAITARLADPWPASVLTARTRAFVIAGPRQWVVTCSAPRVHALPAAIVAALPQVTGARDALTVSLGHEPVPVTPVPTPALAALLAALDATRAP
jgi:hypothetical protein